MIEGRLKKIDGTELVFQLPENCAEIKFRAKLDFDDACIRILTYLSETKEEFSSSYYVYLLALSLSEFFTAQNTPHDAKNPKEYKIDFNTFHSVDVTELMDAEGNLLPEVMESHVNLFNGEEPVDIESSQYNLSTIFEHLYAIMKDYQFDSNQNDYSFEYKGEKFKVFAKYRDTLLGFQKYEKVSLGELVEAFEVTRHTKKLFDKKNSDNSSITLTEHLHLLAILARKEGEKFPMENTEQFIDARARFFLDISLQNASDVFFYLTHSLSFSQKEKIVDTFLIHLDQQISTLRMNTPVDKSTITKPSGSEQVSTV